jgi:P4 family phage/plasmid primase-like protien
MSKTEAFQYDPDYLAENFLLDKFTFDPLDPEGEIYKSRIFKAPDLKLASWTLRYWRGEFYHWRKGRYEQTSEVEMQLLIKRFLHEENTPTFTHDPPDPPIKITRSMVENILLCLAGFEGVHLPQDRELNSWDDGVEKIGIITMSFANGLAIFGGTGGEPGLTEHTPKYFSLARLPYNYEKDAQCPKWLAFLDDVMEGDGERIKLLQQWAGYLLTSASRSPLVSALKFQKFLLIAGEGGNGKTVFATILEKMVGEENVSHIPLSSFDKPFALCPTLGKILNSTSESSHGLSELCETMLKSYTSGDRMTFERKFREPISAHPTAKVMISTNQLPNFTDKSNGIWRRMLFVPFDKTIPIDEQNPELANELAKELPGIFNWAYEGLQKLTEAGRFIEPARCKEAISEYRRDTNPARVFLEENYVEGFEFEGIPCGEMYQSYVAWCNQNGYHPLNASNSGKEVKRAFPNIVKRHTKRANKQYWIYPGLAVREGSEVYSGTLAGCS